MCITLLSLMSSSRNCLFRNIIYILVRNFSGALFDISVDFIFVSGVYVCEG